MTDNEKIIRPYYDGRQKTIDLLIESLDLVRQARRLKNTEMQLLGLKEVHQIAAPFMSADANKEIREGFLIVEKQMPNVRNSSIMNNLIRMLDDLTYKLIEKAKHLLLPQDIEDDSEPDWEALMG